MLEYAQVFDNFYGSPAGPVRAAIEAGRDVLFDVDWQGEVQIRNSIMASNALSIFILPPSITELRACPPRSPSCAPGWRGAVRTPPR